jgi:predicted Zn-dependent peptidase
VKVNALPREWGGSMGVVELAPAHGVSPQQAIDEFDAAMSVLVRDGRGDERHDVARAQSLYSSSWSSSDDSQHRRADSLTLALQQHGNIDPYLTQLDRINALGGSDVVEAVRMWHRPDARAEVVYQT